MARLRQTAACLEDVQRPPNDRERQLIRLKLASPMRAPAGRVIAAQADAAHLDLFRAANEPTLF